MNKKELHRYQLKKGFIWNPFCKYPVNYKCFCNSGKKFKKCCESKINRVLPKTAEIKVNAMYREAMIKGSNEHSKKN